MLTGLRCWQSPRAAVTYTLLFDLDGTLLNPREGIISSIQYALQRFDIIDFADEELLWCIGPPLTESFAKLLQTDNPATIAEAVASYRDYFGTEGLLQNKLYPEISTLLERLNEQGHSLFVATSKPHVYAVKILQNFGLAQQFIQIYGSEFDGTRANKGELISYILAKERLDPAHTLMIGDRKHDILGAQQCGLKSIGVWWGFGADGELADNGATYLAQQPLEVAHLVEQHAQASMSK